MSFLSQLKPNISNFHLQIQQLAISLGISSQKHEQILQMNFQSLQKFTKFAKFTKFTKIHKKKGVKTTSFSLFS